MDDVTTETRQASDREVNAARAQVAELNERLGAATEALAASRRELETLRVTHAELRRTHEEVRSSKAFRLADRLLTLRDAVAGAVRR